MRDLIISMFLLSSTLTGAETAAETKDQAGATAAIAHQLELIRAEKSGELRACFTERLREQITADAVTAAVKEAASQTITTLAAQVEVIERADVTYAKIHMANGRTLTTLVWTDGHWLADTIWFR